MTSPTPASPVAPRRPRTQSPFLTPRDRARAVWISGVGAVVVVALFGLLVSRTSAMTAADLQVSKALNAGHTGALGALTSGIYTVFSPAPAIVITVLVVAVILLVSRKLGLAITVGAVIAVTWVPSAVVKVLVHRVRPDAALLPHPFSPQPSDASFPSGHMVFVTALVVTLILLTRGHRLRPLVVVLGIALVLIVAFALVIDGVHYPSDVLASILWSIGLAPLVLELWNRIVLRRVFSRRVTA